MEQVVLLAKYKLFKGEIEWRIYVPTFGVMTSNLPNLDYNNYCFDDYWVIQLINEMIIIMIKTWFRVSTVNDTRTISHLTKYVSN